MKKNSLHKKFFPSKMEADAPKWNAGIVDIILDEESKKRKRPVKQGKSKKIRDQEKLADLDHIPPNLVDTGAMLREGHPALNQFLREKLKMRDFSGGQWAEYGHYEHQIEEIERMQDKSTEEDDDEHIKKLKEAFIENRKNYEAVKEEAKRQLEKEGVNWVAFDQWTKTNV